MRVAAFCLSLLTLAIVLLPGARAEELKFDEVVLVEGKGRNLSLLYVVLTLPREGKPKMDDLVVEYAKAALREATTYQFRGTTKENEKPKYEGNVVFLFRGSRKAREGFATGFGVGQLRAIVVAEPERARKLVSVHAWGPGELPAKE